MGKGPTADDSDNILALSTNRTIICPFYAESDGAGGEKGRVEDKGEGEEGLPGSGHVVSSINKRL